MEAAFKTTKCKQFHLNQKDNKTEDPAISKVPKFKIEIATRAESKDSIIEDLYILPRRVNASNDFLNSLNNIEQTTAKSMCNQTQSAHYRNPSQTKKYYQNFDSNYFRENKDHSVDFAANVQGYDIESGEKNYNFFQASNRNSVTSTKPVGDRPRQVEISKDYNTRQI